MVSEPIRSDHDQFVYAQAKVYTLAIAKNQLDLKTATGSLQVWCRSFILSVQPDIATTAQFVGRTKALQKASNKFERICCVLALSARMSGAGSKVHEKEAV